MSCVPKADSAKDSSTQILRRADEEAVLRESPVGVSDWSEILRSVEWLTAVKIKTIVSV